MNLQDDITPRPELKPCPFCGSRDQKLSVNDAMGFVYCPSCHTDGPEVEGFKSREAAADAAVNAWQTRYNGEGQQCLI